MDMRFIYRLVSSGLGIPLGLADKLFVYELVREMPSEEGFEYVFNQSRKMFTLFGYESKKLSKLNKEEEKWINENKEYYKGVYKKVYKSKFSKHFVD